MQELHLAPCESAPVVSAAKVKSLQRSDREVAHAVHLGIGVSRRCILKPDPLESIPFKAGDNVILTGGPYQGTPGVFLNLMPVDAHWAEIKERNDVVRQHPLVWLRHFQLFSGDPLGPQIQLALAHNDANS